MEELTQAFSAAMAVTVAGVTVEKILWAIVMLAVCLIVVKLLLILTDRILRRTGVDRSLSVFLRTAIKVLLLFLTVLMVAPMLNIPVTSLVALLSVVGLAVSLAVQNSLSNVAGGIQLLTSKPFQIGDFVEAGGSSGTVAYVGVFYTKIYSTDNKLIQIPNSQITGEKIINYTAQPERRVDLTFTVSYDAPVDAVKQAITQVMGSHPLTLATPEPFVRVSKYGDSSIEYTLRVWCATGDYWTVYFDLLEQVKAAFDRDGIEMTYPHLNVHMVER
jgi:small conductance mechanosensitive channel